MTATPAPALRSFGSQALHYFAREHEGVARAPVGGPASWRGAELAARGLDALATPLAPHEVAELEGAARGVLASGAAPGALTRDAFPLPRLAPRIAGWARELDAGRGFVLLRGLPVERWGDELAGLAFFGMGLHLGTPGAQNPQGDVLGHVTDTGDDARDPFVRRYRTSGDIAFHCDLADVVGLLCLRASPAGGASRIASSVAVHDEILARRPDLLARLYEPFALDSRGEQGDGRAPYLPVAPCRHARGRLRTFYHSDYFRSATRHAGVAPFTADELALLDLFEEIAGSPAFRLDMQLAPGDVQLLSNHTVVHARTAYRDGDAPRERRHLLRLWLSLERAASPGEERA
ncbi:MAG: TauD/TfdA family dioxygenase [Myxococcota bacterium]